MPPETRLEIAHDVQSANDELKALGNPLLEQIPNKRSIPLPLHHLSNFQKSCQHWSSANPCHKEDWRTVSGEYFFYSTESSVIGFAISLLCLEGELDNGNRQGIVLFMCLSGLSIIMQNWEANAMHGLQNEIDCREHSLFWL